ncbi:MAG: hypothetical protein AB1512_23380 [Thermodesulfobacteriota bacterium]
MNNEELILQRLDRMERQLAPLTESARSLVELKEDLTPLLNHAFRILIEELQDVEASLQLEDFTRFLKRLLRNIRNLSFSLEQLENVIDFVTTVEPLLKSAVPQMIHYLDGLEQKGVFRTYAAMLGIRAKIAQQYSAEDFERIGDAFVALLGVLKKAAQPRTLSFLERLAQIPDSLDLATCKSVGPVGMLFACSNSDVKQGLGVLVELTKALGGLRQETAVGSCTPEQEGF